MPENFLYLTAPNERRIMTRSFKTSSDVFVSFNMGEVGTMTIDEENDVLKFEVVLAAQPKLMAGVFGGEPKALKKITCSYHNKVKVAVDLAKQVVDSSGDFSIHEADDVVVDVRQTQELTSNEKMFQLSAVILLCSLFL